MHIKLERVTLSRGTAGIQIQELGSSIASPLGGLLAGLLPLTRSKDMAGRIICRGT
jgi:hypothetical protein